MVSGGSIWDQIGFKHPFKQLDFGWFGMIFGAIEEKTYKNQKWVQLADSPTSARLNKQ